MKVVIPGGSGQVGTILARAFQEDGHDVVILSRGRVKKQAPFATLAKLSMDELYQHGAGE